MPGQGGHRILLMPFWLCSAGYAGALLIMPSRLSDLLPAAIGTLLFALPYPHLSRWPTRPFTSSGIRLAYLVSTSLPVLLAAVFQVSGVLSSASELSYLLVTLAAVLIVSELVGMAVANRFRASPRAAGADRMGQLAWSVLVASIAALGLALAGISGSPLRDSVGFAGLLRLVPLDWIPFGAVFLWLYAQHRRLRTISGLSIVIFVLEEFLRGRKGAVFLVVLAAVITMPMRLRDTGMGLPRLRQMTTTAILVIVGQAFFAEAASRRVARSVGFVAAVELAIERVSIVGPWARSIRFGNLDLLRPQEIFASTAAQLLPGATVWFGSLGAYNAYLYLGRTEGIASTWSLPGLFSAMPGNDGIALLWLLAWCLVASVLIARIELFPNVWYPVAAYLSYELFVVAIISGAVDRVLAEVVTTVLAAIVFTGMPHLLTRAGPLFKVAEMSRLR